MGLVTPAVLPKTKRELEEKLARFVSIPQATCIQIDVVDGRFADSTTWPYTAPKEFIEMKEKGEMLPHLDRVQYEMDLMCLDAESAAESWVRVGATRLTFHVETSVDIAQMLRRVKETCGQDLITLGLAISIDTNNALLEGPLSEVAYVQFMGIRTIGLQGQPFDNRVLEKIHMFKNRHPDITVQVDGGVSLESARKLLALGVENLVVGSGILRAENPIEAFNAFEALENSYGV